MKVHIITSIVLTTFGFAIGAFCFRPAQDKAGWACPHIKKPPTTTEQAWRVDITSISSLRVMNDELCMGITVCKKCGTRIETVSMNMPDEKFYRWLKGD
jgi:hypothetical protein